MGKAYAERFGGLNCLACEHQAHCGIAADKRREIGGSHRWKDTEVHFRQAKSGIFAGNDGIAQGCQLAATTECMTFHQGCRRDMLCA